MSAPSGRAHRAQEARSGSEARYTLARRRDLPALLDRHVPLGPDTAVRLGVRRTDFDQVVRRGWVSPVAR
ncbi:hypothetical protein ACGFNX_39380 [Streptomyces sp. NPDC048723]|uniref:hypothetical protein n=1 Tax=Streptomyces sp. NPDC048723 TaxID=3365589 RepID=UPI0037181C75